MWMRQQWRGRWKEEENPDRNKGGEVGMAKKSNKKIIDSLIKIIAYQANRDWDNFKKEVVAYLTNKHNSVFLEEALLMSYLFLGFPAMMTAFDILRESDKNRSHFKTDREKNWLIWHSRGLQLFKIIYDKNAKKLYNKVKNMHPEVANWMLTEGYGKVLCRNVLNIQSRELLIIAILIITSWEKQLHSHLRGAFNVGVTSEEIENLIRIVQSISIDPQKIEIAITKWHEVYK